MLATQKEKEKREENPKKKKNTCDCTIICIWWMFHYDLTLFMKIPKIKLGNTCQPISLFLPKPWICQNDIQEPRNSKIFITPSPQKREDQKRSTRVKIGTSAQQEQWKSQMISLDFTLFYNCFPLCSIICLLPTILPALWYSMMLDSNQKSLK